MSVSENEKSLRRRVLFNSIPAGTPEVIVQQAIDLLENEFGEEPDLQYVQLVKRLKQSINHEAFAARNLLGKMVMLRNKPFSQIGPDPVGSSSSTVRQASSAQTPREIVFNCMMRAMAEMIAKKNLENLALLRQRFMEAAVKINLSQSCGKMLVAWAKSESAAPSIAGTDEDLHKILNTGFVWMCEKFGPVEADKILLFAVNKAEQLPEAFECSPRNFL